MTCPHLEETSALFDGAADERTRAHAAGCAECSAFLADAAQLRGALREASEWSGGLFARRGAGEEGPERVGGLRAHRSTLRFAVPAFAAVALLMLFWIARPRPESGTGVFAGLDGGGRATITVRR